MSAIHAQNPFFYKLTSSWTAILVVLLLFTPNSSVFADEALDKICDAAWTATQGHKAALEKEIAPLKEKIASIDTTCLGLRKIFDPDRKPGTTWKEKLKNSRVPRLKGTKTTVVSALALLEEQKAQAQAQLQPLLAKLKLVEQLAEAFKASKTKLDKSKLKKLKGLCESPRKAAETLAMAHAQKAQVYKALESSFGGDWLALKKIANEAANEAKGKEIFWGQHIDSLKKLE